MPEGLYFEFTDNLNTRIEVTYDKGEKKFTFSKAQHQSGAESEIRIPNIIAFAVRMLFDSPRFNDNEIVTFCWGENYLKLRKVFDEIDCLEVSKSVNDGYVNKTINRTIATRRRTLARRTETPKGFSWLNISIGDVTYRLKEFEDGNFEIELLKQINLIDVASKIADLTHKNEFILRVKLQRHGKKYRVVTTPFVQVSEIS